MKETWNYKLMDLLAKARLGNRDELNDFVQKYSSIAVVNEDYSILLLLRHFHVQYWQDERRILNCHPETKHFQWGITIVTANDNGQGQKNVYLPNSNHYTTLKIQANEIDIFTSNNQIIKTNITELGRKFFLKFTEDEIETAFKNLSNEQYEEKKPAKPKIKNKTIQLASIGTLIYNEQFNWYECKLKINTILVDISISHTSPKKLEKLIAFANNQIRAKFYEKMLLEMEDKMIKLKNESWLDKNEETGEEELPITVKDFRERVFLESIVFNEDCSAQIYFNDDDIFWGHSIEINIDEKGHYNDANLVG